MKENQISLRVAHLERENSQLRNKVEAARLEVTNLASLRDVLRLKLKQHL